MVDAIEPVSLGAVGDMVPGCGFIATCWLLASFALMSREKRPHFQPVRGLRCMSIQTQSICQPANKESTAGIGVYVIIVSLNVDHSLKG